MYPLPLTSEPHINAAPIYLGSDTMHAILLRNNPRRRETVEDGLDGGAAVVEGDTAEFASIHELDAFAELTVAEFSAMRHAEGRARRLEMYNTVDAEDGRELLASVRQIGDEVEIILREHDGDWVHLVHALRSILTAVGDAYRMLCRHVLREFPDRGEQFFPVAQWDIVMLLTEDQLPDLCAILRRGLSQQLL